MSEPYLVPGKDCFVSHSAYEKVLGRVLGSEKRGDSTYVEVAWGEQSQVEWHPVGELRCGFRPGHIVQDRPKSNVRRPLGAGTVLNYRRIANRDMVLVQLHSTGESRWLPFENLLRIRDARIRYQRAEAQHTDSGERFRLKGLAYALESWNLVTGALDRLDVDPLPHQINLVHQIMTSDQTNWLIADDVGLGKTIEVGLLLAAMKRRRQARRVLIVCPAGVVRQWQDEMKHKFNEDYRIYGLDFFINQPSHWATYDKVIVSMDRAKSEIHKAVFGESGDWDVIVFDEAHHLSKIPHQAVTQRYQLAEELRKMTDRLIFLTGTPHQGETEQFVNLLLLLRPDLRRRLYRLFSDPTVVADVVLRNRKSMVTDANGNFLFRGQDTHLVEVQVSDATREFNRKLNLYLRHGYAASEAGGNKGRAIGFVMTIYRKLASSSIAAIDKSLRRRLNRLRGGDVGSNGNNTLSSLDEMVEAMQEGTDVVDELDAVADQLIESNLGAQQFFDDEQRQIVSLLDETRRSLNDDKKMEQFLSEIVTPIEKQGKRLLIFTEYRATQDYLVDALEIHFPRSRVCQINGSMSLDEKRANIRAFSEDAQFMVSTEAGGEGINLHERCHILVNYDLPWNPSRLVQRLGRLYRYGQRERVIAFNLISNVSFDDRALGMMLERVLSIAQDMAELGTEFNEGLQTEIVGELLERVDVSSILASSRIMDVDRTNEDIVEAINKAKEAKGKQDLLFAHVEGYNPDAASALFTLGSDEVMSFVEGILPFRGIKVRRRLHNGRTLELELPEELRGRYTEFPERATFVRVTVDRRVAVRDSRIACMDFASPFFRDLIGFAKAPEFGGEYAQLAGAKTGTLGLYKVRWENDEGVPRWESLVPIFLGEGEFVAGPNSHLFSSVILKPARKLVTSGPKNGPDRRSILSLLSDAANDHLARRCTLLRHPNDVVLLTAADVVDAE